MAKEIVHDHITGCLPVDQSCFALSRLSTSYRSNPSTCCTTTSYLEVLGISFASLLMIVFVLCVIRCYLMGRAERGRVTVDVPVVAGAKKAPPGLGADAIAALPKFVYRATGEEGDRWECAICISAVADGEVARQLPRCIHLFHRACVDMWLDAHTTCPVCRAEVVKSAYDECLEEATLENEERDLEAQ